MAYYQYTPLEVFFTIMYHKENLIYSNITIFIRKLNYTGNVANLGCSTILSTISFVWPSGDLEVLKDL